MMRGFEIFLRSAGRIVCRPFDKFFNSGEPDHKREPMDWATARVYEKLDGSLIKAYFYKVTGRICACHLLVGKVLGSLFLQAADSADAQSARTIISCGYNHSSTHCFCWRLPLLNAW